MKIEIGDENKIKKSIIGNNNIKNTNNVKNKIKKIIVDLLIGVIIGLIVAYLVYKLGWNK